MAERPEVEQSWLRRASSSTIGTIRSFVSLPPSPLTTNMSRSTSSVVASSKAHGPSTSSARESQDEDVEESHTERTGVSDKGKRTSRFTAAGRSQLTNPQPKPVGQCPSLFYSQSLAQSGNAHSNVPSNIGGQVSQTRHRGRNTSFSGLLSDDSDPGFPDGVYYASEFMVGAGMVILQPSTGKVVIVHDERTKLWFLPKGRKDIGETVEDAAKREAFEEVRVVLYSDHLCSDLCYIQSGYRAEFMPLYIPTNAPPPPTANSRYLELNTEPIYMSTHRWYRRRMYQSAKSFGGEYLTFWFVGMIPENAVRRADTFPF